MGIWGTKPTPKGSLWQNAGDRAPSGRNAKHDAQVKAQKDKVAKAEARREALEAQARGMSGGPFKHPGRHPDSPGHKHPKNMTAKEARAHGLVVTRGFFGGYTVESRDKVVHQAHDVSQEIHEIKREIKSLGRALRGARTGPERRAIARQIGRMQAQQAGAAGRLRAIRRKLLCRVDLLTRQKR